MLKVKDYEIKWRHYNQLDYNKGKKVKGRIIPAEIRITECAVSNKFLGERPLTGDAWCSVNDTFDKDFGRKLALQRAMTESLIPKKDRIEIWEAYRTMTKEPRW